MCKLAKLIKRFAKSLQSLFFFHHAATTEIYTLSLHDALPISLLHALVLGAGVGVDGFEQLDLGVEAGRSEEHTSELQSRLQLVCRLLLEKKKKFTQSVAWIFSTPPSWAANKNPPMPSIGLWRG